MAKGMSKRTSVAVSSAILAIILCLTIVLNAVLVYWDQPLTLFLGTVGETTSEGGSGESSHSDFLSAYATDVELIAAQAEFTERLTGEAVVLLKNGGALPLAEGSAVSLFGITAASGVASGSGSGDVKSNEVHTWAGSMEAAGFQVNRALLDLYANGGYAHGAGTASGGGNERGDWSINEMPQSA